MCLAAKSGQLDVLHRTLIDAALNQGVDFREDGDDFVMASLCVNADSQSVPDYSQSIHWYHTKQVNIHWLHRATLLVWENRFSSDQIFSKQPVISTLHFITQWTGLFLVLEKRHTYASSSDTDAAGKPLVDVERWLLQGWEQSSIT